MKQIHNRLITITRNDIHHGYQLAQTGHAIAEFCLTHHTEAKKWNNNYLISLSIENEEKLEKLSSIFEENNILFSKFYEPDIGNELTSICFIETEFTRKYTKCLKLALK